MQYALTDVFASLALTLTTNRVAANEIQARQSLTALQQNVSLLAAGAIEARRAVAAVQRGVSEVTEATTMLHRDMDSLRDLYSVQATKLQQ